MLPLLFLLAGAAGNEPNPFLVQAKVFQQSLEFEKCLKRLDQAGKWKSSDAERAEIDLYSALCKLGLGREFDAELHFERALRRDPAIALPPLQGPRVEQLFEKVKKRLDLPAPAPAVEPVPPPLVPEAPAVLPPPIVEARPLRLAPTISIASVGAISVLTAAVFGMRAQSVAASARAAEFASDAAALGRDASNLALVANVLYGLAAAALIAGIIAYFALN